MPISPEEKQRHLFEKIGPTATKERIAELIATGKAHSKVSAVDRLYQEIQWEPIETGASVQGFYLGSYLRGPPGAQALETYFLTKDGPQMIRFAEPEVLEPLEAENGKGHLAPIELSGVDKAKNIETNVVALHARSGAAIRYINLPAQLLDEWANSIEQVVDKPQPFFLSQSVHSVRDVVPPDGWAATGVDGKRQRVTQIPPYPVVDHEGHVNVRLFLGGDASRVSLKITKGDELLQLLDSEDADPKAWFDWISANSAEHQKVMDELKPFEGRRLIVFGMGGSEIQVKDAETQKSKVIQLSGSFITISQIGFVMTWNAAAARVAEFAKGDQVIAPRPSAAVPAPSPAAAPSSERKSPREAILSLMAEKGGGATKDEMKVLVEKAHNATEIVDMMNTLISENVIKYDQAAKKYIRIR